MKFGFFSSDFDDQGTTDDGKWISLITYMHSDPCHCRRLEVLWTQQVAKDVGIRRMVK